MEPARDLLFGALAVELNFISRSNLQRGALQWAEEASRDLPTHLVDVEVLKESTKDTILVIASSLIARNEADPNKALDLFGGRDEIIKRYFRSTIAVTQAGAVTMGEVTVPEGDPEEVPAVSQHKGRYSGYKEHAAGGMGRILLVHDEHFDRQVALKELLPEQLRGTGTSTGVPSTEMLTTPIVARFMREAKVTGSLEHPSIVPVYEVGYRADGTLYYTMKLVRGETLQDAIAKCKDIRARLALLSNFLDLCHALSYAHSRGVIHRDIKPMNVMVGEFGETIVIDWGIAKIKGAKEIQTDGARAPLEKDESDVMKTVAGAAIGSPHFMPPEQAQGKLDEIDERSDVYALGAVLYTLLSGQLPYLGLSAREYVELVVKERPKPLAEIAKDAPPELIAIAERAMAPDRKDRYASAKELADEVGSFLSGGLVRSYNYRFSEHLSRFAEKNRAAISAGVIAMIAVLSFAAYSYIRVLNERTNAVVAHGIAENERAKAEIARDQAFDARRLALEERQRALQELYYANIALAERCVDEQRMGQARELLAACPVPFRNWEWGRLQYLCNADLMTLEHGGKSVAFAAGGKRLLAGTTDGAVTLHDLATGDTVATLAENAGFQYTVSVSGNGAYAVVGTDNKVEVWNALAGSSVFTYRETAPAKENVKHSTAINADGTRAAALNNDGVVRVWDLPGGKEVLSVRPERPQRTAIAFRPGSQQLLITSATFTDAGWAGRTALWDIPTRTEVAAHSVEAPLYIHAAVFSADGSKVALGTGEGIEVWRVQPWEKLRSFRARATQAASLAFSPSGALLANGANDGTLQCWDLGSGEERFKQAAHGAAIHALGFTPDGGRIATASADRTLRLWNAQDGAALSTLKGHSAAVFDLAISPNGQRMASASYDSTSKLWDLSSDLLGATLTAAAFSPEKRLLAGASGSTALTWDSASGAERVRFEGHAGKIHTLAFNQGGTRLATASRSQKDGRSVEDLRVWDAQTGKQLHALSSPEKGVRDLLFNTQGSRLVGFSDNGATLWDTEGGKELAVFDDVRSAVFSRDGATLALASVGGEIRVLRVRDLEEQFTTKAEAPFGVTMAFGPGGQVFATTTDPLIEGSYVGNVIVWESGTWTEQARLEGHSGHVEAIAFSGDGKIIVTGSNDRRVKVWNTESGEEVKSLRGHARKVTSVLLSSDEKRIASASSDGTFKLWDFETGREILTLQDAALRAQGVRATPSLLAFTADEYQLAVITQPVALTPMVLYSFPWRLEDYPGNEDTPLAERIEAYKRAKDR